MSNWIQEARAGIYDDLMKDKTISQPTKDHLKYLFDKQIEKGKTIKEAKEYAMLKHLKHTVDSKNNTDFHNWKEFLDNEDK